MFSTQDLEKYIREEISYRLRDANWEKIFFCEGKEESVEGIYVFSKNKKYHILIAERGKIQEDIITIEKEEVLWRVVKILSFEISLEYAKRNRVNGSDFRHALFEKEINNFSLFGENFLKRRKMEIEELLRRNPYKDVYYDFLET